MSDCCVTWTTETPRQKKFKQLWLWLSVCVNPGLLTYFKSTPFCISIINRFARRHWLDFTSICLPVGISFFLFQ